MAVRGRPQTSCPAVGAPPGDGLRAIEEAVAVRRRLAGANQRAYEPALADSLNNLSNRLGEVGRRDDGQGAIELRGDRRRPQLTGKSRGLAVA